MALSLSILSTDGFYPYDDFEPKTRIHVKFQVVSGTTASGRMTDSIKILNDALPPEFQLQFAGTFSADALPSACRVMVDPRRASVS